MTEGDIDEVRAKIRAQCPIHWTWADLMLQEVIRLRRELAEAHAALGEYLAEEQGEVP